MKPACLMLARGRGGDSKVCAGQVDASPYAAAAPCGVAGLPLADELDVAGDPDGRDRFAERVEQSYKVVVGDELLVIDDGLKDRLVQLA
jgi:hypothetical protein